MNQFALKSFQALCDSFHLRKLIDFTPADISRLQMIAVAAGFSGIDFLLGGRSYETFSDEENYVQDL